MTKNFNKYFPWMWEEAKRQGIKKGEWLTKSGISRPRFTEFAVASSLKDGQQSRNISLDYFFRLAKGLGLTVYDVEEKSKIKFTNKQRDKLISISRALNGERKVQRKTKEKFPKVLSDEVYTTSSDVKDELNHKYPSLSLFIEALRKNKLEIALMCLKELEKELREASKRR